MGEFKLQKGDVLKLMGKHKDKVYLGRRAPNPEYCSTTRGDKGRQETWSYRVLLTKLVEVHRPTPDGMVQVWPEVVE